MYQRWVETYGGEEYGAVVDAVLGITDRVAEEQDEATREAMTSHFVTTTRYEWMFWDMGLRKEEWPV